MNRPLLAPSSVAAVLTVVACAGLTPSAAAQGSLRDLISSRPPVEPTATGIPQAGSPALTAPSLHGVTPYGGTVQAAVGPVLWDQPPAAVSSLTVLEGEDLAAPAFALHQVHDVLFDDAVNLTSITTWYTNLASSWPGGITQARVNVFTNDPLLSSDDPIMGLLVSATATFDGPYVKVEALVDLGLVAGAYWIGLTPVGDIEGGLGREFHIDSDVLYGQETNLRNEGGGLGIGPDWARPSDFTGTGLFEGSIRIGGTVGDDCADDCAPRSNQVPNQVNAYASDSDFPAAVAENCILTEATELCELVVWGLYAQGQTAPAGDLFTLIIHEDAAGLPGAVLYSETAIATTRIATGLLIGNLFEEYRYSLVPASRVILYPGTYWFEVTNNTSTDADDDWYWETAGVDAAHGIPGAVGSVSVPGTAWGFADVDLAMQVCGKAPGLQVDCLPGADATVLQPISGFTGHFSDLDSVPNGLFSVADDFVLTEEIEVCDITIWGGYASANTPDVPDSFTMIIHSDQAGAPGPVVYSELGFAPLRVPTGTVLGPYDEYQYVLTPSTTLVLPAGAYWLEVFNNTTGDLDDSWFWRSGTIDPGGVVGHVYAQQVPGMVWNLFDEDLAFRICSKLPEPCVSYCASLPNASGSAAILTCSGDPGSSLVLTSTTVPNTTGQFFFGPMMLAGGSTLGDGLRCVDGATTRILPFVSAGMMMQAPNTASISLNYTAPYASGLTGTKHFQYWFRSGLSSGTGSNTSNAISVTF
ncbi:MAG: hypothetical protein ACI8QZ_002701 [Chlamydiales bacterium]|jgi:hypothetical protein